MEEKGRECAGWRARGGRTRGLRARRHGSLGLGTGEATRRGEGGKMRGQTGGCGVSPARRRCRSIQGAVRAVHDLVTSTRTGTGGARGCWYFGLPTGLGPRSQVLAAVWCEPPGPRRYPFCTSRSQLLTLAPRSSRYEVPFREVLEPRRGGGERATLAVKQRGTVPGRDKTSRGSCRCRSAVPCRSSRLVTSSWHWRNLAAVRLELAMISHHRGSGRMDIQLRRGVDSRGGPGSW